MSLGERNHAAHWAKPFRSRDTGYGQSGQLGAGAGAGAERGGGEGHGAGGGADDG